MDHELSGFEVAEGSIVGRDHVLAHKNNQDGKACLVGKNTIIGVVCDGCGSSDYSDVGAKMGAQFVAYRLANLLQSYAWPADGDLWENLRVDIISHFRQLAASMDSSLSRAVNDYFLFTILGWVVTSEMAIIFGIGDGLYFLNGKLVQLGPFLRNEPPYINYGITGSSLDPELLRFKLHEIMPITDLETLLVGVDGVGDLINVRNLKIPGREELVGPIEQFWTEDRYFLNPFNVARRLNVINPPVPKVKNGPGGLIIRESGLLPDDTTLIVLRKKRA